MFCGLVLGLMERIVIALEDKGVVNMSNNGINAKRAMTFAADAVGAGHVYESISDNICYSLANEKEFEFTDEQRKKQKR